MRRRHQPTWPDVEALFFAFLSIASPCASPRTKPFCNASRHSQADKPAGGETMLGLGQRGRPTSQNTLTGSASAPKPYIIDQRSHQP